VLFVTGSIDFIVALAFIIMGLRLRRFYKNEIKE
jgi:hypothetical protein